MNSADRAQPPRARLVVLIDVEEEYEEEFNRWYDTEHFPERMGCPGFLEGHRFVCLEGGPKYAAIYTLESADVLESEAYRAIADDSPWTARLRPRLRNVTRAVYIENEQVGDVEPALRPGAGADG